MQQCQSLYSWHQHEYSAYTGATSPSTNSRYTSQAHELVVAVLARALVVVAQAQALVVVLLARALVVVAQAQALVVVLLAKALVCECEGQWYAPGLREPAVGLRQHFLALF